MLLASEKLRSLPDAADDFCYLYPENLPEEYRTEEFAACMIESVFGLDADSVQCRMIPYNVRAEALFIDTNLTNGFEAAESPGCLYCNTASPRVQEAILHGAPPDTAYFQNIMFRLEAVEAEQLKTQYHLTECRMTPAAEQLESMQNTMLRIVMLNTVISILMVLLNLSIGTAIIRLQYIINAKRLSVMKILGYSTLQMHMPVFILNLFSVAIGWITNLILAAMYHKTDWRLILLVGIVFIVADTAAALLHIRKLERTNTPKILKGGSL